MRLFKPTYLFMSVQLQQVRICFFGESFVNGTGDPECLGWTGRICVDANKKGYDITYYNLGVRRETSTDLEKRMVARSILSVTSRM